MFMSHFGSKLEVRFTCVIQVCGCMIFFQVGETQGFFLAVVHPKKVAKTVRIFHVEVDPTKNHPQKVTFPETNVTVRP